VRGTNLGLDHDPARVARRLTSAAAVAAVASLAAVAAPALGQELARLPSTVTPPGPGPPLATSATPLELRFPGRISSSERVLVELGTTGIPVAIRVRQRLVVRGKGDYSMSVPAPRASVARAPASESEPGGRTGLVLWQGFSPGRRVLVADAELQVAAAAPYLPLRFRVRRGPLGRELTIRNVTGVSVSGVAFRGRIGVEEAAGALDELRASLAGHRPAGERYVTVEGLEPGGSVRTEVPMRVTGTVRAGGRVTRFSEVVRGSRALVVRLPASGPVELAATAVPVTPRLERSTRPDGEALLAVVLSARLDAARFRQYSQFLANPDRLGPARAVYVFRTTPSAAASSPTAQVDRHGSNPVIGVALAVCALVGAAGLVVWWAHS
jgi:hypothetical protein